MSKSIYEKHDATFANVDAYVICKGGERVATIAVKYGARVTAYVHWIGLEMVQGFAGGGGYDRVSAAIGHAVSKIQTPASDQFAPPVETVLGVIKFKATLSHDDGHHWDWHLREAGFTVFQAV
jgi:hypothetical protein